VSKGATRRELRREKKGRDRQSPTDGSGLGGCARRKVDPNNCGRGAGARASCASNAPSVSVA
jgi:hypothetical protein